MLASTHFDPVLGIDIHIVLVPSPAGPVPTPTPMPFLGMVFDPVGLVVGAAIGMATSGQPGVVLVNQLPATNCGTEATQLITAPHLPAPGVAFARGLPGNNAELFFGAYDVSFQMMYAVRLGDIALSCSDPVRLPTSAVLALPKGFPVLIMRPPMPDMGAIAMAAAFRVLARMMRSVMRAGGRLFRFLRRAQRASSRWSRIASRLHRWVDNIVPRRLRSRIHRSLCHLIGHPVDVATGRVLTDFVDFELPGPLPLRFERVYDSSLSWREGVLGCGWSHSLDQAVWRERGKVIYRAEDGREIEFHTHDRKDRTLREGDEMFLPFERLTLRRLDSWRYEVRRHDWVTYEFAPVDGDTSGRARLIGIRDRNGHRIELSYDTHGRLDTVRDSGGRLVRMENDEHGRLVAVKLPTPLGEGWYTHRRFRYDENGDLGEVTDSLGKAWRFEYVSHLLVRETDRTGLSFYFQYDGLGSGARCIRTWGDGGIYDHVLSYDLSNRKAIVEDAGGGVRMYETDEVGRVCRITDPVGGTTEYEYDDDWQKVTLERSPDGAEFWRSYDARGNLSRLIGPDFAVTEITWDDTLGVPSSIEDPSGARWFYAYDSRGNLIERISPAGESTTIEWEDGLVRCIRGPESDETRFEYTPAKLVAATTHPNEAKTLFSWDALGRTIKVHDPLHATSAATYDTEGRVRELRRPGGLVEERQFDAEGNCELLRTATREVRFTHGHFHRVVQQSEGNDSLKFDYDGDGRLTRVENELGHETTIEYDRAGRAILEKGFDGRERRFLRDICGRVTGCSGDAGNWTRISRDAVGRPIEVQYPGGSSSEFEYDSRGLMTRAVNASADVRFEYDALGRVIGESQDGGQTWVRSRFGPSGRRWTMKSDLGALQETEFDLSGEVSIITLGGKLLGTRAQFDVHYDVAGRELDRVLPGGVNVRWRRDEMGRPLERVIARSTPSSADEPASLSEVLNARSYQWRGEDQIAAIIDAATGPTRYEHDGRGRLVAEETGAGTVVRAMDPAGNPYRLGDRSDRTFGAAGQLLKDDGREHQYDGRGNLRSRTDANGERWTFAWNGPGLLEEVQRPDGSVVRYEYDAFARRTRKTVFSSASDNEDRAESETCFVWDGQTVLHELASGEEPTTWYWHPGTLAPLARERGGSFLSVATDHLGTPTEMFDQGGRLVWSMRLDIYGSAGVTVGEESDCPWRWPGQYADPETGDNYSCWRYYSPSSGQFLSRDPIGLWGGPSPYGYVSNPDVAADPMGWLPLSIPTVQGHHLLPHSAASHYGLSPFNSQYGVPSYYFTDPPSNAHSLMHGYNMGLASTERPPVRSSHIAREGLTQDQWLARLRSHYSRPELAHLRGDVRIVTSTGPGEVIAHNVSPSEAFEIALEWGRQNSGC